MTDGTQRPDPDAGEPGAEEFAVPDTAGDSAASRRRFWLALIAVVAVVSMVATSFSFLLFSASGGDADAPVDEPAPARTDTDTGGGVVAAPGPGAPDGEPADAEQTAQIEAVTEEFIAAYNDGDLAAMRATLCAAQADQLEIAGRPAQRTVLDGLGHVFVDGDRATARADLGQAVNVDEAGEVLVLQEAVLDYRDEDGWKLC